jgi:ABC-type branched-subunit amino acid transport system permease subunit
VIAAIGAYCVGLFLMLFDNMAVMISGTALSNIMKAVSMRTRYEYFTLGVLGIDHIIYFACLSFFFVFLTANRFEKRRWA